MKSPFLVISAFMFLMAGVCLTSPQPAIIQQPSDWTLDVRFEHPQQIEVKLAGDTKTTRFWYVILTLTNKYKKDVDFYPLCELMTDTFQIIPAGKNVPTSVFDKIKTRHKRKYQFLQPVENVGNKILQGEDNTLDVVVIWPDFDKSAKGIKLFITGLSNETAVVEHPVAKDQNQEPVKIFLRKTLELNYNLGGDPALRNNVKLTYKDKRWIMR